MDLWIRSQDKTRLSIITNIQLVEWGGEYSLVGYTNDYVDDFDLGKYKTKERALEVLDEIQNLLKQEEMLHINKSLLNDLDDIEEPKYILRPIYQPRVYEMPEE